MQKLRLWYRITEEQNEERIGPLIISRLQGPPFQQAMSFSISRGGVTYRGDEAMALPTIEADIQQGIPGERSGIRQFLDKMRTLCELHDQDRVGIVMDAYFEC